MINIEGYEITGKIYSNKRTNIFSGIRKDDGLTVVIKTQARELPLDTELKKINHDFEIGKLLNSKHITQYYDLINIEKRIAIIKEDFGGQNLKIYLETETVGLKDFLNISKQIVSGIEAIHNNNIIHKDIKPSNIIINPETIEVKITDFSLSTVIQKEIQSTIVPARIEGTLNFISPEQTGRMNRPLDYRTDFYSLGITLYNILTTRLPFDSDDPIELVHSHIAKKPTPPHEINRDIPVALSKMIMKLMSKNPEERYQSTGGIKHDLNECMNQLARKGIIKEFPLGNQDISEKFIIPEKLYGRENEIAQLMESFNRASKGPIELFLISGYSGIGKSALVNEIYKPVTLKKGYFISGKYDLLKRNIAYSALTQALQSLVRQLLSEDNEIIKSWGKKLLTALGPNGQVVIDVIPEVELIIGKQPPVRDLAPAETQNRFNMVFINFIKVFTQKEHPLVIFLDDLQWADSASLNLIKYIVLNDNINYLLIVGAYRDNEVDDSHPTMITLKEIQEGKATVSNCILSPLNPEHVNRLIADTLMCPLKKSKPLAKLIHNKTNGNPFFIKSFLLSLYSDQLLTFSRPHSYATMGDSWQWNMKSIEKLKVTDNVVDLFIKRINQLSKTEIDFLKLASSLGNSFILDTLVLVSGKSQNDVIKLLHSALNEGMIFQFINRYHFIHDRVQEASYSMIPVDKKKEMHLHIGRLLLLNYSKAELEENIFDVLSHLNKGRDLITDRNEKIRLAELSLKSSKQAKESAAYDIAKNHLAMGMDFLPDDKWENYYNLTHALYYSRAEVEFLVGNFTESGDLYKILLDKSKTNFEKSNVCILQINQYSFISKYPEAIDIGREALKLVGMDFPIIDDNLMPKVESLLNEIFVDLKEIKINTLIDLPENEDLQVMSQINILSSLLPLTYYVDPGLLLYCAGSLVNLSIKHGNAPTSPAGYSFLGIIMTAQGKYEMGYQFGNLGLNLAKKYMIGPQIAMAAHMFTAGINHWRKPVQSNLEIAQYGYKIGLESGDIQWSTYTRAPLTFSHTFIGIELNDYLKSVRECYTVSERARNELVCHTLKPFIQYAMNLLGKTDNNKTFNSEGFNEEQFLKEAKITALMSISWFYSLKSKVSFLYGKYKVAIEQLKEAENFLQFSPGQIVAFDVYFFRAISMMALYADSKTNEKKEYLQLIDDCQIKIRNWSDSCPENFQSQNELVTAERLKIEDKTVEAMEHYENSISLAGQNGFMQIEALANELYAKFWISLGRKEIAAMYMHKSYYLYKKWGAIVKVKSMDEEYGEIISFSSYAEITSKDREQKKSADDTLDSSTDIQSLDLMSVIKASQAISGEINLRKLLSQIIQIIVENAGAQKGFLIRKDRDKVFIQVQSQNNIDPTKTFKPIQIEESKDLCIPIINYVLNSGNNVIIHDAIHEGKYSEDPYIQDNNIKSILCTPFQYMDEVYGVLYLENNLVTHAFTEDSISMLQVLLTQAAISMENAELFEKSFFFQNFVEESGEGLGWANLDSNILFLNKTLCRILEVENPEELYGKSVLSLYPEDMKHMLANEIFPIILKEGIWTGELTILSTKGKEVPTQNSLFLLKDSEGNPLFFGNVVTDITERKRAEEELSKSRDRLFRAIFDQTFQFIGLMTPDGILTEANKTILDFAVVEEHDVIGKPIWETIWWAHSKELQRKLRESVSKAAKGELVRLETFHRAKDGKLHFIDFSIKPIKDENGKVVLLIPEGRDITDRKLVEDELINLRNYLKNILDSMPSIIAGVDMQGNITQWNNGAESATGITAEEAEGKMILDVLPFLEQEIEEIKESVSNRKTLKIERVRKEIDGENNYSDITVYPLMATGIDGAVIRIDDVTEGVRLAEMMIQSEKMLSVGGLAAGMAHEINNPLAGILQNLQVLNNRLTTDIYKNMEVAEKVGTDMDVISSYMKKRNIPDIIDNIFESGKRAAKIVQNMLSFSRKSTYEFEPFHLSELLDSTLELAESDYDLKKKYDFRDIKIIRKYKRNVPAIPCDSSRIQQVLLNILKNGAEAMTEWEDMKKPSRITLQILKDGEYARIEIKDNGPGMNEDVRKRVFEPFYTTKPIGKGIGLGLSVSYFIITENHQGEMSVESSPGKGANFIIKLPIKNIH
ncbi:AAA family ATPase [Spirochaetota bacterium]